MNTQAQSGCVAVVCEHGGKDRAAMETYLRTHQVTEAHWYARRDLDEVNQAVRSGNVQRVVFPKVSDLLDGLWTCEITFDQWLAAGTRVEFVESPEQNTAAHVKTIFASWEQWRRLHRRRQVVAGIILSIVALAAAFALNWSESI